MGKLTTKALKMLSSKKPKAVSAALILLEEIAAVNSMSGFKASFKPKAQKEILSKQELKKIQKEVIRYIENNPNDDEVITAFWCLSKFFDRKLLPFFVKMLARYFDESTQRTQALGQIILCLDNLGEKIISGGEFSSLREDSGKTLVDAHAYLKRTKMKRK
ncbi:MAG: hypothetical protein JWQ35_962 [Bacteriovoracaceae bacterium]|nr:hypothetical protein [Bacteriovoracaceae bacterium]